jgi:periplasmic protein TonB
MSSRGHAHDGRHRPGERAARVLERGAKERRLSSALRHTLPAEEPYDAAPPAAPAHTPPLPVGRNSPRPPGRLLIASATAASGALHVAVAAALLLGARQQSEYGVLTNRSDAMSLETTQTIVLESIVREPIDTAAASAAMPQGTVAAVDAEEAEEDVRPPQSIKAAAIDPVAATSEQPLDVLRGAGEPDESLAAKTVEQKTEEEQKVERKQIEKKRRKLAQRLRSQRQTAGGPASRSSTSTGAASGRASASRGSVLSYAARVRAKVARNKPSGIGRRGTASVAFGVSPSGDLSYARLARSSGNPSLDAAALSAVERAAPFGAPPADATAGELRFAIPFYFR